MKCEKLYHISVIYFLASKICIVYTLGFNATNATIKIALNQTNCDLQNSTRLVPIIKCLKLCQKVKCKNLVFNASNCTLIDGDPSLIEILRLPEMNINYVINRNLLYGERCDFAPDKCSKSGQLKCLSGTCKCYEDPKSFDNGLIYNWPFCFGYTDTISGLNLTNFNTRYQSIDNRDNTKFLLIDNSYLQAPPGIYFNTNFTISLWVYVNSVRIFSKPIDFGNGPNSDNIAITFSLGGTGTPYYDVFYASSQTQLRSSSLLPLNQWIHLAVSLSVDFGYFYINGTLISSGTMQKINNITRTRNYIGKSNWNDELVNAYYRKLRIYNRSLALNEIQDIHNNF